MESVEAIGRTVDEAVENALDDLGLERDEVTVTVLAEGGESGQARVLVTPRDDLEEIDELEDDLGSAVQRGPSIPAEVDEQPRSSGERSFDTLGTGSANGESEGDGLAAPGSRAAPVDAEATAELAESVLVELLDRMDLSSEVEIDHAEVDDGLPSVQLSVHGEYGGILIGRHGDTLAALQFLVGLITSRRAGRRVRVVVDVEGYRERRAKLLRDMATRAAERAQRYRQPIFMDPMLPAERRIVHLALQDNPNVSTHSIGEGDNRRVVVSPRQAQRFGGYGAE